MLHSYLREYRASIGEVKTKSTRLFHTTLANIEDVFNYCYSFRRSLATFGIHSITRVLMERLFFPKTSKCYQLLIIMAPAMFSKLPDGMNNWNSLGSFKKSFKTLINN